MKELSFSALVILMHHFRRSELLVFSSECWLGTMLVNMPRCPIFERKINQRRTLVVNVDTYMDDRTQATRVAPKQTHDTITGQHLHQSHEFGWQKANALAGKTRESLYASDRPLAATNGAKRFSGMRVDVIFAERGTMMTVAAMEAPRKKRVKMA